MTTRCHRLAQITDLHLRRHPDLTVHGCRTLDGARRVVDLVAGWQPDLVVASGDLADEAEPEAYAVLADLLTPLGCPVIAVAGNHDNSETLARSLADTTIEVTSETRLGNWRIHLLDSSVPGVPGGTLDEASLAALDQRLDRSPSLVFVHHQPVPVQSAWIDAMGLSNGNELVALARRQPSIRALCCGHVHHAVGGWEDGVHWYSSPSTCLQFVPLSEAFTVDEQRGPGFRWFELYDDGRWETGVKRVPNEQLKVES